MADRRTDLLLDPRFLTALVLLVVNDHLLKGALGPGLPGIVTGKLSDVAAMVLGPVLVAVMIPAVAIRRPSLALLPPGLLLAALNLSGAVARAYETSLEWVTGLEHRIVVDPSDLLGLAGLVLAQRILTEPRPLTIRRHQVMAIVIGIVAIGGAAASSQDPGPELDRVRIDDEGVLATSSYGGAGRVSDDDGVTWQSVPTASSPPDEPGPTTDRCLVAAPEICVRLADSSTIEESEDGGQTWASVWRIDHGSDQWLLVGDHGYTGSGAVQLRDLAETDAGSVLVAASAIDPIRRSPDGAWLPTPGDLRRFQAWTLLPLAIAVLAAMVGLAAIGSEAPDRRRDSVTLGLGLALVVPGVWFVAIVLGVEQLGLPLAATVLAVLLVVRLRRGQPMTAGLIGGIGVLVVAGGVIVILASVWLLEVVAFLLVVAIPIGVVAIGLAVVVALRGSDGRRLLVACLGAAVVTNGAAAVPLAAWSGGWSSWQAVHLMAALVAVAGVALVGALIRRGAGSADGAVATAG